jgi:hypothetical protein
MDSKEAIKKIFERKMTDAKDIIDEMLNAKLAENLGSLYEKLDPVGKEDGDIDNDGDEDDTDSYLLNRRKKIGQAMKKEGMQYEGISDRPQDGRGRRRPPQKSGPPSPQKPEPPSPQGPTRPEMPSKSSIVDSLRKKIDSRSLKFKKMNEEEINEVDLSHQSAHDHKETEAIEKSVRKTKVNAKGGTYNGS